VYRITVVRYNSDTNSSTKGSAPGSISYGNRSLRLNLFAAPHFVQSVGLLNV
jgi:hypothetical protein